MVTARYFTGRVTEIDVGGQGPASGQLEFSVTPLDAGVAKTFIVTMETEARVFSAMATLLTMAYRANLALTVEYLPEEAGTPRAINVRLPATE